MPPVLSIQSGDVTRDRAACCLFEEERDLLAFGKEGDAVACDRAVVHEYIFTGLGIDVSKTL